MKQKMSMLLLFITMLVGFSLVFASSVAYAVDFDATIGDKPIDADRSCLKQFPDAESGEDTDDATLSSAEEDRKACEKWQAEIKDACKNINSKTDKATKEGCARKNQYSGSGDQCGGVATSGIIPGDMCDETGDGGIIFGLLKWALGIMNVGVGIAAVGGMAYGALLYTTAESKPEQTKKAIGVITNVVIGIAAYALMYVVLNFLVPGGVFS